MISEDERLRNEVAHGTKIVEVAGAVWNWESPATQRRWRRRSKMLTAGIKPNSSVLELGCGVGYFTKELAKTKAQILAIDISSDLLNRATTEVRSENVRFKLDNAYDMDLTNESFDHVVGSSVLHHLDIKKALAETFRVLKHGGKISFTEPNMLNPQIAVEKNIGFIGARLGNTPDETAFFKWQIRRLLHEAGFKRISVTSFDFLHPATPSALTPLVERMTFAAEKMPLIKEFAGSLYITAEK